MTTTGTEPARAKGRHHRSLRNYLLDPGFQLKYTAYLVAIAVSLSSALGVMLSRSSREVLAESRVSVTQGMETVRRGQELARTSQKLSDVVRMNIADKYADNPELSQVFNKGADEEAARIGAEQKRLEAEALRLEQQSRDLEQHERRVMLTLLLALSLLVALIGAAGIVITHRVAGPIFKMKRQLRELGEGHLRMPFGLRKGDELVDFFLTFEETVRSLRARRERTIASIEQAMEAMAPDSPPASRLRALCAELRAELD